MEMIFSTIPSHLKLFALADQLLNQDYIISLDNYYSSPDLFNLLNHLHTDAAGTVRFNWKGLPENVINCNLKRGGVVVSYKNTHGTQVEGQERCMHEQEYT
jgi:hypothetical protein